MHPINRARVNVERYGTNANKTPMKVPPPPQATPQTARGQLNPLHKKSLTKLFGHAADPMGTPWVAPAGRGDSIARTHWQPLATLVTGYSCSVKKFHSILNMDMKR